MTTTDAQTMRLHHFGISVANLEETIDWYGEKLGFTVDYRYEIAGLNAQVAFMTLNDFRIEIFEIKDSAPMPESSRNPATDLPIAGLKHIAISVHNIEETVADLESRNVEFLGKVGEVPNSNGEKYIFFRDNNGILIELYQSIG